MTGKRDLGASPSLRAAAARWPWWASLLLAALSFVALRMVWPQGWAQYGVPLVWVVAAAWSAWQRHRRSRRQQQVTELSGAGIIDGMGWPEFDLLVREGFRRRGYAVSERAVAGAPNAELLTISRGREVFLVQCQHWRAFKLDVPAVRELHIEIANQGAAGGFVVTSGMFTPEATRFAEGRGISLIDGLRLYELIRSAEEKTIPLVRQRNAQTPPHDSDMFRH